MHVASHVQLTLEEEKEAVDELYLKSTRGRDKMENSR